MPPSTVHYERVLVAMVPEAEALVGRFRAQHDPSAVLGMPAHVTINYPFRPERDLTESDLAAVAAVCAAIPRLDFQLTAIRRFPSVVYLAPEPQSGLEALIAAVAARFPDSPPYAGRHRQVIPHLTVAQIEDASALEAVAREFQAVARARLPIACHISEITLFDNPRGRWEAGAVFALGKAGSDVGPKM